MDWTENTVPVGAKTAAANVAAPARKAPPAPKRADRAAGPSRWLWAALGAVVPGAVAGYFLASAHFKDQVTAIEQASDLRVAAANQRIAELQQQLQQVQQQSDFKEHELTQEADEEQRQIVRQAGEQQRAALQQQRAALAEQAKERERDLAKPDLPVRVWMRRAAGGRGLAGQVHNFGTREITLSVTAHRGSNGQQAAWNVAVPPNATQAIAGDDGWPFAPGDELDINADGFRPMIFQVPQRARPAQ
jgi:beta-glucosidase-like glycosyl hydrolase